MQRRWKDADVFLLFNEGANASTHTAALATQATRVEVWDPQTGASSPLAVTRTAGGLEVTVALMGYETCVLVAR